MFKKIAALYALIRKDAAILWFALRHPARPAWLRPSVAMLALYLLSPIDLIPDVLPVIGLSWLSRGLKHGAQGPVAVAANRPHE